MSLNMDIEDVKIMSDEWFFLQSMKRRRKEKEEKEKKLELIRQKIKDTLTRENEIGKKLMSIEESKRLSHPLRFEFISLRSAYWDLIAEMRDIEKT